MTASPETAPRINERGLALLDVLIGMAIFALIATIAMQSLGQYRQRAFESGAISDVQQAALALQASYTDTDSYPVALDAATLTSLGVNLSRNNTVFGYAADGDSFVMCIEHKSGAASPDAYAVFDSSTGGIAQSGRAKGCAGITLDPGSTPLVVTTTTTTPPPPPPPPPPPSTLPTRSRALGPWVPPRPAPRSGSS